MLLLRDELVSQLHFLHMFQANFFLELFPFILSLGQKHILKHSNFQ